MVCDWVLSDSNTITLSEKIINITIVNRRKEMLDSFNIISDCCKFMNHCFKKTMALTDNSMCWQRHGTAGMLCTLGGSVTGTTLAVFAEAELVPNPMNQ